MKTTLSLWLSIMAALVGSAVFITHAAAVSITTVPISFPEVTLNGTDQTVSGSTSAWQVDAVGESGGWNVTVSSTEFNNGIGKTIAVANFEIRLLDANIVRISGDINGPVSTQTAFTSLSGTALNIASTAIGDGDGVYDLTPDLRLTVPAETYTGSYTATVTVEISTGP